MHNIWPRPKELSAFVTAVHHCLGPEQARWLINMGVDSSRNTSGIIAFP